MPVAIPGLVIGVAYLWAWIGIPGGLYGTIWILALAFIARFMPDTVKALSTSFLQIHRELEEAAWVCGKGMLGTIRTIVLPLARPGVIASMTLLFVLAIRELGSSLFLYTSNTMVMSVLLLDYYEGGNLGKTAAFSLVQTVLLGVLIGGANWLSTGRGAGQRRAENKDQRKGGSAMSGKIVARIVATAGILGLGVALNAPPARAQAEFGSPELIAAAKAEGKLVYYTANFAEVEQQVIKEFNKRFPEIKVEMVRAPGGQLITRVKTEAAAGKLIADVVDHSDRALMLPLADLFQDYAPPNAADYNPDAQISPKLWPRATLVWSIAYNTELVKNPPKTWMDLTKPEYDKMTGQVFAQSGGTTWTRIMFERQVLGEDYWAKQAATHPILYPSGAPMSDALVRGEIAMGPLLYNAIYPKQKDGAPIKIFFPPEGAPVNPYASGIPKTAAHPNAAKLFLNWCLSKEGQTFMIKELGNLTSLKVAPVYPEGFDPKVVKVWYPKFDAVREAARRRGSRNGTRPSATGSDRRADGVSMVWHHDGDARGHRPAQAVRDRPAGDRRRQLCGAGRRDRGAARAVRLRQDHDLALRRRAGASDLGRNQHRRAGGVVARARHPGAAAAARPRHGVSVLRGVAAHDGAAERDLSAQAPQDRARRGQPQGRRGAGAGRAVGICRPAGGGAVRRPDAARRAWRAASSTGRSCCCSTSPCPTSMPNCACGCATICASSSSRPA